MMSGNCRCGTYEHWVVPHRRTDPRDGKPAVYSTVVCTKCGGHWRCKAKYIDLLPDPTPEKETA